MKRGKLDIVKEVADLLEVHKLIVEEMVIEHNDPDYEFYITMKRGLK